MISVDDLHSGKRALVPSFGINAASVPSNDFHSLVLPKPVGKARGRSDWEQINNPWLHVHWRGSVLLGVHRRNHFHMLTPGSLRLGFTTSASKNRLLCKPAARSSELPSLAECQQPIPAPAPSRPLYASGRRGSQRSKRIPLFNRT